MCPKEPVIQKERDQSGWERWFDVTMNLEREGDSDHPYQFVALNFTTLRVICANEEKNVTDYVSVVYRRIGDSYVRIAGNQGLPDGRVMVLLPHNDEQLELQGCDGERYIFPPEVAVERVDAFYREVVNGQDVTIAFFLNPLEVMADNEGEEV